MNAPEPSPPAVETPPTGAWAAAAAAGVDMGLLESNLRLTPTQRLARHQHALELAQSLARGRIRRNERVEQPA